MSQFRHCTALEIKHMFEALGHRRASAEVKTYNGTAIAFSNNELKAKRAKSWDMRLHWLRDRIQQQRFGIT